MRPEAIACNMQRDIASSAMERSQQPLAIIIYKRRMISCNNLMMMKSKYGLFYRIVSHTRRIVGQLTKQNLRPVTMLFCSREEQVREEWQFCGMWWLSLESLHASAKMRSSMHRCAVFLLNGKTNFKHCEKVALKQEVLRKGTEA